MSEDQKQKQSLSKASSAPIPSLSSRSVSNTDDDLDLTVKIKEGDGDLHNLDLSEEKNDIEKFRDESKNIVAADAASDSVLKDLQKRAVSNEVPLKKVSDLKKEEAKEEEKKTVTKDKKDLGDEMFFDLSELKPLKDTAVVDKDLEEIVTVDSLRELKPENVLSKETVKDDHAALKVDEKIVDLDAELGDGLLDLESIPKKIETVEKKDETEAKLEKVDVSQRFVKQKKTIVAPVQTLMRTETIHDRSKKTKKNIFKPKRDGTERQGKALGAVEELKLMSFEEWNRLGDIAEERIMKIKEKIEALGEKGVIEQIKGINAWRACQIMQEYLTVGINALIKEKGIEDYFSKLAQADQVTLTLDEWYAINKLNSQLMI